MPPESMMKNANEKKRKMWFKQDATGKYSLKTLEELEAEGLKDKAKVRNMCFEINSLDDVSKVIKKLQETPEPDLENYSPILEKLKKAGSKGECFAHFLKNILRWEPELRYTPLMALQHPFVTGLEFDPSFVPLPDPEKDTSQKKQQYVFL